MEKKPPAEWDRERDLDARENAVANRETRLRQRETATGEHEIAIAEREEMLHLREEALRARAEADASQSERDRLVEQMKRANEQLVLATVRADEMAERAHAGERAKDEFLAMLGHELRNPLSPIMTAIDLMEMQAPELFSTERAMVRRQVRHMVRLVDDLLDISRITGGKVQLQREPIELSDVIARAIELVSPLFEAKGHELVVDVPSPGLVVDADPARLTQVAANLLANAAKYTPQRGRIVASGRRVDGNVVLSVRDNGIGISKDMLPRVFDMFTQARQSLDRAQGGLGLGLAIVKTLVSLHDGIVTAHSEGSGHGSEFVVTLRAFVATTTASERRKAPAFTPDQVALKILIVDDNHDIADLTADALSRLGHDVRVAYDGPSALASVIDFLPDVAVLDIGLPGMDGYALIGHLRAHLGDTVRFVAVSGYGQASDRQRSRDAGFAKHLVKPVSLSSLRDAMRPDRADSSRPPVSPVNGQT